MPHLDARPQPARGEQQHRVARAELLKKEKEATHLLSEIATSRRDLPAAQVAYWMFNRWRQENFFKYLREEYALDALADHAVIPDDPTREVPNPAWAAADATPLTP